MNIEIRPASKDDAAEWLQMRTALWPTHDRDLHLADMKSFETDPNQAVFVAALPHGGLVGFVEVSLRSYADGCRSRPVGYIEGWYVDPRLRHRGIGRRPTDAAEAWAIQKGCAEMGSDCLINNDLSFLVHLAAGYEETARLIHFRKSLVPGSPRILSR